MTKSEFKKTYGEYRKTAAGAFYRGVQAYKKALDSNQVFRACFFKLPLPVSLRVRNHLDGIR